MKYTNDTTKSKTSVRTEFGLQTTTYVTIYQLVVKRKLEDIIYVKSNQPHAYERMKVIGYNNEYVWL